VKSHIFDSLKTSAAIALAYFALSQLSFFISSITGFNKLFVLSSGVALATLLVIKVNRALLGILLGGLLVTAYAFLQSGSTGEFSLLLLVPALTVTVQAYLNHYIYRIWVSKGNNLSQDEHLFRFLQVVPIIGFISTLFSLFLQFLPSIGLEVISPPWYELWVGHTLGLILIIPVVLALLVKNNALWKKRRSLLLSNFIFALSVTSLICFSLNQIENNRLRDRFEILTNQTATLFQVSLTQKKLLQESVAQLFVSSEHVTRQEFQQFIRGMAGQNKYIQVIEWLPKIKHSQRESYEREQRNYYGDEFSITQIKSTGLLMPARNKDVYFPITFLEPEKGNESAEGFDPSSSFMAKELISKAVINGHAHARPPINIIRKAGLKHAFIVYRPVFENFDGKKTLDPSEGKVIGLVNIVVRVDDFIHSIVGPNQTANFHIQWQDSETGQYYFESEANENTSIHHIVNINLFERDMKLIFTPTETFISETKTGFTAIAMVTSFFLASLLSVLILNITARTSKIQSEVKSRTKELLEANLKLEELSNKDPLTNLYNRRFFSEALLNEFTRAKRYNNTIALINLDIDQFKSINDQYGHPCGDEVIKSVADYLLSTSRASDILARTGGEEFALILPVQSESQAYSIVERIRIDISNIIVRYDEYAIQFSCSFGIAMLSEDVVEPYQLIKMADKAMYKAKRSGKNKTVLFSDL